MDIFDLSAKITLDTKEFESGIGSASGSMESLSAKAIALGNAMYDIGKKAAEGIGQIAKNAVGAYADFEQFVGGIDTLFKDSSQTVQTYADNAYKTAGVSANKYMDTATSFAGALLQSLGNDTAAAAEYADLAIRDMADNSNKMGTSLESIQNAYQGFAKQNFSMLDNLKLGYGGTQAEMYRLLQTAQDLDDSFDAAFSLDAKGHLEAGFSDIVEAIHIVQNEMGITGTTALEAEKTITGSVMSMKAAWENWLVGLGDEDADLSGLTDALITGVETAASNVLPALQRIGSSLITVLSDMTGVDLSPFINTVTSLGNAFKEGGVSGAIDEIVSAFARATGIDLSGFVDGVGRFFQSFSGVAEDVISSIVDDIGNLIRSFDNPQTATIISGVADGLGKVFEILGGAISLGLEVIADIIHVLVNDFDKWGPLITGVAAAIGVFVTGLGTMSILQNIQGLVTSFTVAFKALNTVLLSNPILLVVSLVAGLAAAFVTAYTTNEDFRAGCIAAWDAIKSAAKTLCETIKKIFTETIPGAISDAVQAIKDKASEFVQAGKDLIDGLTQGIAAKVTSVVESVKGLGSKIIDGIRGVFDEHSPSRVFRRIGEYAMEGMALGFDDGYRKYSGGILGKAENLIPDVMHSTVDFSASALGKSSAATINGIMSASSQSDGGTYNINLVVDGRTLANVVFDPLNAVSKQRGVPIGA